MAEQKTVLVVGASGVIGAAAVEHFGNQPGLRVLAVSRRAPFVKPGTRYEHVALDITDAAACAEALAPEGITHLIYAAVSEAPKLTAGWRDADLMEKNRQMFANVLGSLPKDQLRHAILLQGTKAYGGHYHPVTLPSREEEPRDPHPNFYWLQEDVLRDAAGADVFSFTIFRPQVLLGGAPRAVMNPVAAIGAYAAICREIGRPFAFPGRYRSIWEMVDSGLLAKAFDWAMTSPAAARETFNFTNGDLFVLADAWQAIAKSQDLEAGPDTPLLLADFFAEHAAVWPRLVERHGLIPLGLDEFLGESHHYLDLLLGSGMPERPVLSAALSTIKIRQAGFNDCIDSRDSAIHWLNYMRRLKLLP